MSLRTLPAPSGAVSVLTAPSVPERKFGELLIEEGAITREQLEDALRVQSASRNYLPLGQVLLAAVRIDQVAALERPRQRVHGEVAGGEVLLDRLAVEGGEIDRAPAGEGDAPGAVALREREDGAAAQPRVEAPGELRVGAGDVDVDDLTPEQLVPERAADHPRRPAAHGLSDALIHRRACAPPAPGCG